nr:unnamed protein product [Callosobruchus chinensis]CAH7734011.1 unnamed protein product [Callosobruchus chinensis]
MPIKLGITKITKSEHLILYSFDVNLVISEVDIVKLKTEPNIDVNISLSNPKNFSFHLDQVELDEIHKIRRRMIENSVDIHSVKVSHIPSFWTIILYGVLLMIVCCFVYKKITPRCFIKPKPRSTPTEEINLSNVHLSR